MDYLKNVKNILEDNKTLPDNFSKFSKCYLSTTENIKDYQRLYDFKGKKVLSVCASGDQALSAISNGASEVKLFDSNSLTKCLIELKKALILSYDLYDYLDFFDRKESTFLDKKMYSKVRELLNDDIKEYFDYVFSKFSPQEIFDKFFISYYLDPYIMEDFITYYDPEKYEFLKSRLGKVSFDFITSDIYSIKDNIKDEKFDIMLFSNIADYIVDCNKTLVDYRNYLSELQKNLSSYGIIEAVYIYNFYHNAQTNIGSFISYGHHRKGFFESNEYGSFIYNYIKGYQPYTLDGTITLMKTK